MVGANVRGGRALARALTELGMPAYASQPPTGYADEAVAWVNTGALLARMNLAAALVAGDLGGIRGTDHGYGNAVLALGGGVRGGHVYGEWPGLESDDRFRGRDLAVTTDFRDLFGEVLVRHLGVANTGPVFPDCEIRQSRFTGFLD